MSLNPTGLLAHRRLRATLCSHGLHASPGHGYRLLSALVSYPACAHAFRNRIRIQSRRIQQHLDTLARANLFHPMHCFEQTLNTQLATFAEEPLFTGDLKSDGLQHRTNLSSLTPALCWLPSRPCPIWD